MDVEMRKEKTVRIDDSRYVSTVNLVEVTRHKKA